MNGLIPTEIHNIINNLKESCTNTSVEKVSYECTDVKTASMLFNIFRFADQFDERHPLVGCRVSLSGKSIQL